MKKLIFITLLLSFFVNAQIELRFNDFYINNYSKISYKKIQVTESNYTNFEALNKSKNEEKFWLKIEPRKLTKEEEIYNKDPNNLDVQFDFSTYLIRINIDCKNKFFRLIEQYRYDNNKKLVSYNDYNNPYGSKEGVLDFNNKDLVSFLKDSDYYSFYLEKCTQK